MAVDSKPQRVLDDACQKLLEALAKLNMPALSYESLPAAREGMRFLTKVSKPTPIFSSDTRLIETAAGDLPVRIYRPSNQVGLPVVIFCHGGGWALCDLDTHDDMTRQIANGANCVVVSVDYRLAPEHKFPAAIDDVYQALIWVYRNAERLQIDKNTIALVGDSAGGNLAAVTALKSKDMKGPPIALQCLLYPVVDLQHYNTESYNEFGEQLNLKKTDMEFFKEAYLSDSKQTTHPYVSPLCYSDLSGLPDTYIVTAGFDVLRDDGKNYADKLKAFNNNVEYKEFGGLIHGFLGMTENIPNAQKALNEIVKQLKNKLHKEKQN